MIRKARQKKGDPGRWSSSGFGPTEPIPASWFSRATRREKSNPIPTGRWTLRPWRRKPREGGRLQCHQSQHRGNLRGTDCRGRKNPHARGPTCTWTGPTSSFMGSFRPKAWGGCDAHQLANKTFPPPRGGGPGSGPVAAADRSARSCCSTRGQKRQGLFLNYDAARFHRTRALLLPIFDPGASLRLHLTLAPRIDRGAPDGGGGWPIICGRLKGRLPSQYTGPPCTSGLRRCHPAEAGVRTSTSQAPSGFRHPSPTVSFPIIVHGRHDRAHRDGEQGGAGPVRGCHADHAQEAEQEPDFVKGALHHAGAPPDEVRAAGQPCCAEEK